MNVNIWTLDQEFHLVLTLSSRVPANKQVSKLSILMYEVQKNPKI